MLSFLLAVLFGESVHPLLHDVLVSLTILATTLVLLNKAHSLFKFVVDHVRVAHNFVLGLIVASGVLHRFSHLLVDFSLAWWVWFWLRSFLFLFFALLFLLWLNFFFEGKVDFDAVVFLEVPGNWDLDNRGVVLQVKQKLVQVNIERTSSGVELSEVFFHVANPEDRALEDFFHKDALLGVHHLIVALLELTVNVDIFDVQAGQMLEDFVVCHGCDILDASFVFLSWYVFNFDLLLQVVHCIT